MTEDHFVIIGNGPAANSAALTLRECAPDTRVTMISRELVRQYKPKLLPDFVAGKLSEEELYVRPLAFYKEHGIKLRLGQEVVDVDFAARRVTLAHKEVVGYSGLIIAVGGKPYIPAPLQVFEDFMMTLKTISDAHAWIERLSRTESVLMIGGDLTSLAFTRALLSLGKNVYFILDEDSFWPLRLTREIRDQVAQRLVSRGVNVVECRRLKRLARVSEKSVEVVTDTDRLKVGVVGAFFGLVPDVKFLAHTGIHVERGVLVDEHLKTRFDGVYAVGIALRFTIRSFGIIGFPSGTVTLKTSGRSQR
ncbi:MAG: FAD-dependent oxidoreductase [Deltaproteobacteria bacterium]